MFQSPLSREEINARARKRHAEKMKNPAFRKKRREHLRAYAKVNPGVAKKAQRKYKEAHRFYFRKRYLEKEYGLSVEDYNNLYVKQGGVCAICKSSDPGNKQVYHFAVDHDHETGRIRGLLCDRCNRGIGLLRESVTIIRNAAAYLEGVDV